MNAPLIHGKRRCLTATDIRETLGDSLAAIRLEDRMTWVDLGEILGKSEDQAAKYADGSAEMGVVSYTKARIAFGSRFTGALDKLVERTAPAMDAHQAQSCILKAALALSVALEDGKLTDDEIRANRGTLERARDAIDAQLARLGPKASAA